MDKPKDIMIDPHITPSQFAQGVFKLDGKPFSLKNRKYLLPIYNDHSDELIIMSGRQVEKSTTNSSLMAMNTLTIPYLRACYVAPIIPQVKEFSNTRIGKIYEDSQERIIERRYVDKTVKNNVFEKTFLNGSVNYFRHCYGNGDNIRGITVNLLFFDEFQDIEIDAVPVVKETQSHALDTVAGVRRTIYTGTPKTFSNTIQQFYEKSTQNEWTIRCPHCGRYQIMGEQSLSPTDFVCRVCKKPLPQAVIRKGMWVPMNRGGRFPGYLISQLMVPWTDPKDIWNKYQDYSRAKFYNEVLGRSYEDADKPFDPNTLSMMLQNNTKIQETGTGYWGNRDVFMGVDWGTGERSFTVITIGGFNDKGVFQIVYVKRCLGAEEKEHTYQEKLILSLFRTFRVRYAIFDWGFGETQGKNIMKNLGPGRAAFCYYSASQVKKVVYNPERNWYTVNRTSVMYDYIKACKDGKIAFPGADRNKIDWLLDHHMAEYQEYRKSYNGKSESLFYSHPESQPDDGVHSCNYAYFAATMGTGKPYWNSQSGNAGFTGISF